MKALNPLDPFYLCDLAVAFAILGFTLCLEGAKAFSKS